MPTPVMTIVYDVFKGNASGGPIDYTTVVTTTSGLSAALAALPLNSTTRFGVRARDTTSGNKDRNTDAAVMITVSATGTDLSPAPHPPAHLRAYPGPGGAATVEWTYPYFDAARDPTGFHVYQGTGGTVNYATPAATVTFAGGKTGQFAFKAGLSGLTGGTTYSIGVRAYNAAGEELNTTKVSVLADSTAPTGVTLTATATY